jgi:hypothetical protein
MKDKNTDSALVDGHLFIQEIILAGKNLLKKVSKIRKIQK